MGESNAIHETKSKNVLYIGNYGRKKTIGSQIKKTLSISNYLEHHGIRVIRVNSEVFKTYKAPLNFLKMIYGIIISESVIISLNKNGLIFMDNLILKIIDKFPTKKKIFITIGGWIAEFINEREAISKYLINYNKIFVQAEKIKKDMNEQGFRNVENMKNFREFDLDLLETYKKSFISNNYQDNHKIRLVFFAVIREEKGLDTIVNAIKNFELKINKSIFELDIYGPIMPDYKDIFNATLSNNSEFCRYKGIIHDQNKIYKTLNKYDFMIFPTFYEGEGFPTAIVESFISGLPVIASDWKYNKEIIINGYNGLTFETGNLNDLINKLEWVFMNRDKFKQMHINCLNEAKKYHPSRILYPILESLKGN